MSAEFIAKSPVLEPGKFEESLSAAVAKSLLELKQAIKDHQIFGEHTGKITSRGKISGGVISHRASAKGESPAPLTFALVNSTREEQFSATSGEVRVEREYGAILQNKLERDVTKTPEKTFSEQFTRNIENAVKELL